MKYNKSEKYSGKQNRRKCRRRVVSLLTAAVVFVTTYALVLPAITMDADMAAAEPGIEVMQPASEPIMAEPVTAEIVSEEPAVQPEAASYPSAADETLPESTDVSASTAFFEATESAQPAGDSETESSGTVDESGDDQSADITTPEENETAPEEDIYTAGPFICDTPEYKVTVSFGPEAQIPEGTTLSWGEYIVGSAEYDIYRYLVNQKLIEDGTAETDLESAVSALRVFTLHFMDRNGAEIRPAAPVDVLVEYKTPANPVTNEKLYAVTFRTDDGQTFKANLAEQNIWDNSACVEAEGGVIQRLRIQDFAANDFYTDMTIAQLAWQQVITDPAKAAAEEPAEPTTGESGSDTVEAFIEESREDAEETSAEKDGEDAEEGAAISRRVLVSGAPYSLHVQCGPDAGIPKDAEFTAVPVLEDHTDYEEYKERALTEINSMTKGQPALLGLFDLSIYDAEGNSIQPSGPITVTVEFGTTLTETEAEEMYAVHFVDSSVDPEPEQIAAGEVAPAAEAPIEVIETESQGGEATFETESLSVYAVVYTVDFEYSVNGKMYQFSLPGGGFVSFTDLVEVLGIIDDTNAGENEDENGSVITENAEENAVEIVGTVDENATNEEAEENGVHSDTNTSLTLGDVVVGDASKKFVADVASVEFSNPELVDVSKVDADTTVGQIKESRGLEVEYSAELTEEQIAEINAKEVKAGDWALISMQSFTSEESLTVTMKNGDTWMVKVTDAQEIPDAEKTSIDVNKSYLICYEVNDVYYLLKNDGSVDNAYHPDFEGDTDAEHDFEHLNSTYCWSFNHIFKEQDVEHHLDKNYYLIRPIDDKSKTLTLNNAGESLVQQSNNNVAVIQNDGGFILEGYHNIGTEEEPRYVHLGFSGGAFAGVDGDGVTVHIYEMDSLPTYDYTVCSADEIRGTVTVQGGTQQNVTEQGTVVAHYWDATSNHDKKNAGTITATPVTHVNQGQNKWLFDHWELDGLPLDRDQYGATISANTLPIPYNGSNLVAYFRQNPNYTVPPNEKEPSSIEDMTGWLEELQTRNIPLDGSATKKTAEVYDYQNRIYRVDFTSKANFETFAGNIDMAFCLDVSNSMYFPSALVETTSANRTNPMPIYQINNSGWYWSNQNWLDTSRNWNNPYYLVADASGTATVFKIYYQDGQWKAQDASRTTENDKSFVIGDDFRTNWTTDQFDNGNNKNHPFGAGDNDSTTYMIYDAGDEGKNRFVYLNQSLSGSSTDLNTIANLLAVAGDSSPGVRIAYNTFNKDLGNQRMDFQPASSGLTVNLDYASGGGTRPDQAFNDAQNFSWTADYTLDGNGNLVATDRYVILVTDGAPQGKRDGETGTPNYVGIATQAATALKNNSHVKLITIGLSMENVTSGKNLLYDLADKDSMGNKMFYLAESASDLGNIFRKITKVLMEDAVVVGDITDTVSEGFYLVDKATGMPLKANDTIDIEGNLTTDESKIAGVVQPDGKTIVWTNQPIDSVAGWHGTVYVKAQEELLGGNGMDTNDGTAEIVATKYRVGGKDVTFDTSVVRDTLNLTAELPSPKVNVNELTFFNSETEWTVYLGEEVDPKRQLKALYDSLVVEEVVNEDGSLHYTLSPNSIEERWDALTGTAATFSLPGLIEDLIREDLRLEARYYEGSELNWDVFLEDILDGGITLPYHEFGLADGSNIT